jgi:hypothetical protein
MIYHVRDTVWPYAEFLIYDRGVPLRRLSGLSGRWVNTSHEPILLSTQVCHIRQYDSLERFIEQHFEDFL